MFERPIIVVGGSAYADIDVLACVAAYKQCLLLQGYRAHALITGPWNQTIPLSVRQWKMDVESEFQYEGTKCNFILVDFSDPKYVDQFVDLDSVIEVFDHHYGYETYWKEKLGNHAKIEKVGACATLIWEEFKIAKIENKITPENANLLYTAIMANTLDFKSAITQERDRSAAKELLSFTQLPSDWNQRYYTEIDAGFSQNPVEKILQDTKNIILFNTQFNFAQIELANAREFLQKAMINLVALSSRKDGERWVINIVSILEGCSYLYCNCLNLLEHLTTITQGKRIEVMCNEMLVTPRLWLRKELLKEMIICENKEA